MIIWLNGGFGAGKTTLARELQRRVPDAVVYDPEQVGVMLWKWLPPNGDFQDLPSWRELVVAAALSLRRHHADTLLVPMTLIRDAYRAEILGGLAAAGEDVLHVFLEADAGRHPAGLGTLRRRGSRSCGAVRADATPVPVGGVLVDLEVRDDCGPRS